jgi:hypothetical protein
VVGGDAADRQFTIEVTRGARVVYQTLNPPYERWVEGFPALQVGVLAAAEAQGAGWSAWRTSTCTDARRAVR